MKSLQACGSFSSWSSSSQEEYYLANLCATALLVTELVFHEEATASPVQSSMEIPRPGSPCVRPNTLEQSVPIHGKGQGISKRAFYKRRRKARQAAQYVIDCLLDAAMDQIVTRAPLTTR